MTTLTLTPFLETEWEELGQSALPPLHSGGVSYSQEDADEFAIGAALLRLHGEWVRPGYSVQSQQALVSQSLAVGHKRNAFLLPRRSSKSTSLIAVGLGRAYSRPDYRVAIFTLTSGKAGRSRFLKDVAPPLERIGSAFGESKAAWPFKIVRRAGSEAVEFRDSGGSMTWISSVEDLRGEAFDMVILDEAQAADVEKAQEVIAAALPTMDTRPGAQMVVAGTAGDYRPGNLLWEWLEDLRIGEIGGLEYAIPAETPEDLLEDWATVEPLVLACHPGIGTLTTLESIRNNFITLKPATFAKEYLGVFGKIGEGIGVFNAQRWEDAGVDTDPGVPEHFAIAMACSFTQGYSSIVAAWRDDEGRACGYVLDHRRGTTWLADEAARRGIKHGLAVVYDSASSTVRVEVEAINRMDPQPMLAPQTFSDIKVAAALLVKEVNTGNARHFKQDQLSEAAKITVRRSAGETAWALGRPPKNPEADISPVEAWAMALRYYDDTPAHEFVMPIMAT